MKYSNALFNQVLQEVDYDGQEICIYLHAVCSISLVGIILTQSAYLFTERRRFCYSSHLFCRQFCLDSPSALEYSRLDVGIVGSVNFTPKSSTDKTIRTTHRKVNRLNITNLVQQLFYWQMRMFIKKGQIVFFFFLRKT